MKRRHIPGIVGIPGAVSCLLCVSIGPAGLFGAGGDEFTIRNEVRLVLLDVSVQNRDGNFVPGLSKPDFTVLEDGRPQAISVFDNEDAPVTMGILVDESASMTQKRAQVLAAAQSLIAESNRQDEVFVLNFNDSVKRGLPEGILFSDKIPQLREALYRELPNGKTALYDAVADGLTQLEEGRRGRKTLIVVNDMAVITPTGTSASKPSISWSAAPQPSSPSGCSMRTSMTPTPASSGSLRKSAAAKHGSRRTSMVWRMRAIASQKRFVPGTRSATFPANLKTAGTGRLFGTFR